jgi:hypothetical protein
MTKQIGGTHYGAAYGHWDLVADTGMGYFPGQITKYLTRWRKKGGLEDLRKALTYAEKYMAVFHRGYTAQIHGLDCSAALTKFRQSYPDLGAAELQVTKMLADVHVYDTVRLVANAIEGMIAAEEGAAATRDYVSQS